MKVFNFFIVFYLTSMLVSGQTPSPKYEVTYDLNYRHYKNDISPQRIDSYKLYINNKHSIFSSENLIKRFGLDNPEYPVLGKALHNNQYPLGFDPYIIIKEKEDYIYIQLSIKDDFLAYQGSKMNLIDWELKPDTTVIAGLKSQKALCNLGGRNWVAWFTTEIPISDGPYKFSGLPGLITKIESEDGDYSFQIRGIDKVPDNSNLIYLPKYKIMPYERFKEYFDRRINSVYEFYFDNRSLNSNTRININGKKINTEDFLELMKTESEKINTIEKSKPE